MNEKPEITELRDQPIEPTEGTPETVTEPETEVVEEEKPQKTWAENFGVKEKEVVETVERLQIIVGVNEYKGSHLVFLAKVTDKNFSKAFFSMPAYVWEKAILALQKIIPKVAEVEKQTMTANIEKELARLKELGIDITAIAQKVAGQPT